MRISDNSGLRTELNKLHLSTYAESLENDIIHFLKKTPKVLIIDEVNNLKDDREVFQLFGHLNTIYRETRVPIIVITNNRNIRNMMPDDARKTLLFEIIEFPAYKADE